MIEQGHRVGYNLKTFVQTAIVLAVDMFKTVVAYVHNFGSIIVNLATAIHLKLNTEETVACAVKDWIGLVIIILDVIVTAAILVTMIA
jgi:hypothetical protein